MSSTDTVKAQKILEICKHKLDNKVKIEEVKKFVIEKHSEDVWQEIHKDVSEYNNVQKRIREKNKRYWMLISNPSAWYDEKGDFIVNKRLYELDENKIQHWKIDGTKDITEQMKEGEKGILKVSDDKRTEDERADEEGNIVDKLNAGIYGIFTIVKDEDGDCIYEDEDGYWFVNIKVINNFYSKGKMILKNDAIELLGNKVYSRMGSGEIDENIYERILEYQERKRRKK